MAVRPLRDGVIADFEAAERMLSHFIRKVAGRRLSRPRVVVCVPSGISSIERRAVIEAAESAGARQVRLLEEPMAAAIGAGLPVSAPLGSMVVDIGGGTTEIAVVSLGGIVAARSVRTAGYAIDAAIISYVKRVHGMAIGESTAEKLKAAIGSAAPGDDWPDGLLRLNAELAAELNAEAGVEVGGGCAAFGGGARPQAVSAPPASSPGLPVDRCRVRGRYQASGLPKTLELSAEQVREAVCEPVEGIIDAVRYTLDECPPELAGDIMDRGIVLTGGGALLRGLDRRISSALDIPVRVADNPLACVVLGAGQCVEDYAALRTVLDVERPLHAAMVGR
jgi:rod shape-determining protein MreB